MKNVIIALKKWHATALFLMQIREKMNRNGTFFNDSGPIQKSRILWMQMNEKICTFNNGRQKNMYLCNLCIKHFFTRRMTTLAALVSVNFQREKKM
jgi:hypothetical protein